MSLLLPKDLIDRGFHLVKLPSGKLIAISPNRGVSKASRDLETIVRSARAIASFCEHMEHQHER